MHKLVTVLLVGAGIALGSPAFGCDYTCQSYMTQQQSDQWTRRVQQQVGDYSRYLEERAWREQQRQSTESLRFQMQQQQNSYSPLGSPQGSIYSSPNLRPR